MPPRRASPVRALNTLLAAFLAGITRLDKSLNPRDTLLKLQRHHWSYSDTIYLFHALNALFWVYLWPMALFFKLSIIFIYSAAILLPLTSQFFLPATPVLAWVITFFSSRFIPVAYRPPISVSLLPTLESVLYGANISDILTRFTHPILDILAWLPYGVLHFTLPFVLAAFIWLFRPKEALHFFARAFGYMNLVGVIIQIVLPCAPPWYELIYGLTPATYAIHGSAAGLSRIDTLFGSEGYAKTFASSPVVFGAFPSLHSAIATMEALVWSHFFPWMRVWVWAYAGVMYWATMYLTHHYLIDVVAGACLATAFFYLFLPVELGGVNATRGPGSVFDQQEDGYGGYGAYGRATNANGRSKYELYDLEAPTTKRRNGTFAMGHARGMSGRGLRLDADADSDEDGAESGSELGAGTGAGVGGGGGRARGARDLGEEEEDVMYRSPNLASMVSPTMPQSAVPLMGPVPGRGVSNSSANSNSKNGSGNVGKKTGSASTRSHKHTASIASLRSAGGEDGSWSPRLTGGGVGGGREFVISPVPGQYQRMQNQNQNQNQSYGHGQGEGERRGGV